MKVESDASDQQNSLSQIQDGIDILDSKTMALFVPSLHLLDICPEMRVMILEQVLSLPKPLRVKCQHKHDATGWMSEEYVQSFCSHSDDDDVFGECDHVLDRPSRESQNGQHMFWLALLANKQIYQEAARLIPRRNTIVFTSSTLECFVESEWQAQNATTSVARPILSEEMRTVRYETDFTGTDDLAGLLAPMSGIKHLTLVGTKPWLRTEMMSDLRLLLRVLPNLTSVQVELDLWSIVECGHCGSTLCDIGHQVLSRALTVCYWINRELKQALAKRQDRARWRAARQLEVMVAMARNLASESSSNEGDEATGWSTVDLSCFNTVEPRVEQGMDAGDVDGSDRKRIKLVLPS